MKMKSLIKQGCKEALRWFALDLLEGKGGWIIKF